MHYSYEILSDDTKRAAYDRYGPEGVGSQGMNGGGSAVDPELFAQFFAGFPFDLGGTRRRQSEEIDLDVTLEPERPVSGLFNENQEDDKLPGAESLELPQRVVGSRPSRADICAASAIALLPNVCLRLDCRRTRSS